MSDERLNRLIDEEAREVTNPPPDSGAFRRGVLVRIGSADKPPQRTWRAAIVLTPICVAAAVVIAAVLFRAPGRETTVGVKPGATAEVRVPSDNSGAVKAGTRDADPFRLAAASSSPVGPQDRQRRVRDGGSAAPPAAPAAAEPVLRVDPVVVAPLTIDAIVSDPIRLQRLESITPIDVAPLDFTDDQRRQE